MISFYNSEREPFPFSDGENAGFELLLEVRQIEDLGPFDPSLSEAQRSGIVVELSARLLGADLAHQRLAGGCINARF